MPEDTGQGHCRELGREPSKSRLSEKVTCEQITEGVVGGFVHLFIYIINCHYYCYFTFICFWNRS